MNRKIIFAALLMTAALSFAACGSRAEIPAQDQTAPLEDTAYRTEDDSASEAETSPSPTPSATPSPTPSPTPTPTPTPTPAPVTTVSSDVLLVDGKDLQPILMPGTDDNEIRVRFTAQQEGLEVIYAPESDPLNTQRVTPAMSYAWENMLSDHRLVYEAALAVTPGERYIYSVTAAGEEPEVWYTFRANPSDSLRAVFVSDTHLINYDSAMTLEGTLETAMNTGGYDLVCHLGDMLDNYITSPAYFTVWDSALRSVPVVAVPGNHDLPSAIYEWFPMINEDSYTRDWWTVRGGVLIVGININVQYYAKHAAWLREQAENFPEHTWTVVMIHYSMHSNGCHACDGPVLDFRYVLEPVFEELDVDLVLSGHDHEYDRSPLLSAEGVVEGGDGNVIEKDPGELLYLTVPSGTGIKYYERNRETIYEPVVEGMEQEPGYVLAEFLPESIHVMACRSSDGSAVDDFILCRASAGE